MRIPNLAQPSQNKTRSLKFYGQDPTIEIFGLPKKGTTMETIGRVLV